MRISFAIFMVVGGCTVVLVSLLSVLHDLLARIPRRTPAHFESRDIDQQTAPVCPEVSEDIQ